MKSVRFKDKVIEFSKKTISITLKTFHHCFELRDKCNAVFNILKDLKKCHITSGHGDSARNQRYQ